MPIIIFEGKYTSNIVVVQSMKTYEMEKERGSVMLQVFSFLRLMRNIAKRDC